MSQLLGNVRSLGQNIGDPTSPATLINPRGDCQEHISMLHVL